MVGQPDSSGSQRQRLIECPRQTIRALIAMTLKLFLYSIPPIFVRSKEAADCGRAALQPEDAMGFEPISVRFPQAALCKF
jgi:hypothetical protein